MPSRRTFLSLAAVGSLARAAAQQQKLALEEFQPKSMLVVPENPVPRAKYPVIDVHTHLSSVFGRRRARSGLLS